MKNEFMVRAMGEIDDDLLEEARRPLPKKKFSFAVISRYAAAAACFVLIFVGAAAFTKDDDGIKVWINGTDAVSAQKSDIPIEIELVSAMQQRNNFQKEISIGISAVDKETFISAGEGGFVLNSEGIECESLVIESDTEIIWLVDVTEKESFELTVSSGDKTVKIIASIAPDKGTLAVTASCD